MGIRLSSADDPGAIGTFGRDDEEDARARRHHERDHMLGMRAILKSELIRVRGESEGGLFKADAVLFEVPGRLRVVPLKVARDHGRHALQYGL